MRKRSREDFPGDIRAYLVSRARAVKRKFSDCQHTSSDGPSGTKFNFPTMTTALPSLGTAAAHHPFCRGEGVLARAHQSNTRASDDIRSRNTLCLPRKFPNARSIGLTFAQFHRRGYLDVRWRTHMYVRAYVKSRLKFRLLDPR